MTQLFRLIILTLLLSVTAQFGTFARAAEQSGLSLKGNIKIETDVVKIGDLFDNSGFFADVAIFSSPAPGKSGTLKISRIITAIRNHGLEWNNPQDRRTIIVSRAGKTIPMDDIRALIAANIAQTKGNNKNPKNIEITFAQNQPNLIVPTDQPLDAEVLHLSFNNQSGRFSAVIAAPAGKKHVWHKTYRGRAADVAHVPVLNRQIRRGDTISRHDIEIIKISLKRLNTSTLRDPTKIIGLAARRTLRTGRLLRSSDLRAPILVGKNTLVLVTYNSGNLRITTRVRSLSDGAMGEAITVINPKSNRKFQVSVIGYSRAEVASAQTRTAALTN